VFREWVCLVRSKIGNSIGWVIGSPREVKEGRGRDKRKARSPKRRRKSVSPSLKKIALPEKREVVKKNRMGIKLGGWGLGERKGKGGNVVDK